MTDDREQTLQAISGDTRLPPAARRACWAAIGWRKVGAEHEWRAEWAVSDARADALIARARELVPDAGYPADRVPGQEG